MVNERVLPGEIRSFAQEKAQGRFSTHQELNEYILGFNDGYKSSLLDKSPNVQQHSGSKVRDIGFQEGRTTGLSDSIPKQLSCISLRSYGYLNKTVAGLIYFNFEQHDFRLLNSEERWWVSGGLDKFNAYNTLIRNIQPQDQMYSIYTLVDALVSPQGLYGHLGRYRREMKVLDVIEIRRTTPHETIQRKELEKRE